MFRVVTRFRVKTNFLSLSRHCDNRFATVTDFPNTSLANFNSETLDNKQSGQGDAHRHVLHTPVMLTEVLQYLTSFSGKTLVDMTFGAGGHSSKILEIVPDIKIFALDRDPVAHKCAQKLAEKYPGQVIPLLGRFSELPYLLAEHNVAYSSIDCFLFDFGCSSMQFDVGERGFSIAKDGPLDMRMDGFRCPEQPTAADVLEQIEEHDLANVIKFYGEEKRAKKIARAVIEARYSVRSLQRTSELARIVESTISNERRVDAIGRSSHCATKTFQAIRIFVNNELNEINYGMVLARSYLKRNGLVIAISFHSLEDTIVKRHLRGNIIDDVANTVPLKYTSRNKWFTSDELTHAVDTPWKMLHKHILVPPADEINRNPRSRSAKFRAIVKIVD